MSVASAQLTNSSTRKSMQATVMYKDLDGYVLPLPRLGHIQVAGYVSTMGNQIERVYGSRKIEIGLRPRPELSRWEVRVCPIRYGSPRGATINFAVFDRGAHVALHDVLRFQVSRNVKCTDGRSISCTYRSYDPKQIEAGRHKGSREEPNESCN